MRVRSCRDVANEALLAMYQMADAIADEAEASETGMAVLKARGRKVYVMSEARYRRNSLMDGIDTLGDMVERDPVGTLTVKGTSGRTFKLLTEERHELLIDLARKAVEAGLR